MLPTDQMWLRLARCSTFPVTNYAELRSMHRGRYAKLYIATHNGHTPAPRAPRKRSFAGDPVGRGRRPAIDAAPNDIKCEQRPSQSRRSPSINELAASLLDVLPQLSWMRRAPKVSSSASTHARRVDPARSSTGLASGERGLGQQQQVGDFLRCAAPMSYPCTGQT